MKVLGLLLLAGISLAAFPGDTQRLELSPDPRLKGYKPLNTYTYQYEACLTSGFPDTEQQYAGLKITCDTEFYIESDSWAYLKIRNPQLFEVNGTSHDCSSDSLKVSPVSEELVPLLEQPIKFKYVDGKIGEIYCNDDEPEYILNIKRGILAILHHNFTTPDQADGEPRMYKNWEYGSHGLCENMYDVQYMVHERNRINGMRTSKILNLNNCTGKPRVFSNVPGVRCLSKNCDTVDEPLKISFSTSCDMLGSESKFVVKICKTVGKYIFAPSHMKGSAATMVKQFLKFKAVKAVSESFSVVSDTPHKLEMTGYDEDNKTLTDRQKTEMVTKTIKLIEFLIKSVDEKRWMSYKFTALVEMLRKVDKETLIRIWDRCYNDDRLRLWLLEALPFIYKQQVFEVITDKIQSRDLKAQQAVPVLRRLALTPNPTEGMCQEIWDLCSHAVVQEDETLKMVCYLTEGALMHEYCKDKDIDCLNDKALEIKSRLTIASYQEKIFILKSIGNFGHKSLYRPLLDIIQDTRNTLELRVIAVYALRRITPKIPQKVLPVLLQIFRQVDNDAELRMACFVVICDSKPGPAVFNLIIKQLYYERTNQVRSFVASYIKGMAFSRYPCDERMAKTARVALKLLRRHRLYFLTSKWLHWGEFSEPHQLGGTVDLQMISTPSSFVPRAINSKVKVHVLGKSVNLFETGIRGEGIQELLKRVVGVKQQDRERKTLPNMLKPKSSYDKEVRQINKLLPITTEYEDEKAKGSFYFKVLGKELWYNHFTYDDVRELIEDGVIRVNDDLRDMFKNGKKFNLTKVLVPVEVRVVQPSAVGIPLKFILQSVLFLRVNTTIKAEVQPKFFLPLPDHVTVNGSINISVLHSTWGKMKICLPQLETGSKMKVDINITAGMGGRVQCDLKQRSYTTEVDLPQHRQQIFSTKKQGYTFLMYTKPVGQSSDWQSLYRSTPLDGLEIGEVVPFKGEYFDLSKLTQTHRHHHAEWTLKTREGKYLSVNEQNELILSDQPTVFKVIFIDRNRQFVKLYIPGKGYVKVKPNSKGCLETVDDERYPKLFKITYIKGLRHIRLATVVFIHPTDQSKNPTEWTKTTVPMNTDQVVLIKKMIEDIEPQEGYEEKWRYVTDLPLDDIPPQDRFHPRHMRIVFITPVDEKVCLRPNRSEESVFTVKRQHRNTSEVCYGEQVLGMDVCLSGDYIDSYVPDTRPAYPFCGPTKYDVFIKPGINPASKIQFKLGKGDRYDDDYKTWKADMTLVGTTPEKKVETRITHDVNTMETNINIDMHNMLPWLREVCITSHVISGTEARFFLKFGENCQQYRIQSVITIKEPGRRQLNIVTSYNQLPASVMKLCYKLFRTLSSYYRDRLSGYQIMRSPRNQVEFVVKFKTEQFVDLKLTMPSRVLTMDDVRCETDGFILRGNPLMHLMALSAPVCTVDFDTFKTFDDVEFQFSLPHRCAHVLAKDCVNNTFMVLVSKEAESPDNKIVEIFVEKEKIRIEYLGDGRYQIQVNGAILDMPQRTFRLKSIATIVEIPEKQELHVMCEHLQVLMVRGNKVDVRVSPFFFNRTCGMCGDCNAEQYMDLKTPRGRPYTSWNKQKYGHMWMVPEDTCNQVGCHFKKEFVLIRQENDGVNYDCYPTTPVLRCLDECQATKTKITHFPMTCVKTGSVESVKILKDIEKRTLDLTGSEVRYTENLTEHLECDCSTCGQ